MSSADPPLVPLGAGARARACARAALGVARLAVAIAGIHERLQALDEARSAVDGLSAVGMLPATLEAAAVAVYDQLTDCRRSVRLLEPAVAALLAETRRLLEAGDFVAGLTADEHPQPPAS